MRKILFFGLLSMSLSAATFAYTMTCPAGANTCQQCFGFELGTNTSSSDIIVPRTGLTNGQKEAIDLSASTINAQTLQGASVSPTGNILSSYNLNAGPNTTSWTWATMKSPLITVGTLPAGVDYQKPVYQITYTTQSHVVGTNNAKISGTDVSHVECAFFFAKAPVVAKINGQLGSVHTSTVSNLSSSTSGLCTAGDVINFQSTNSGWTWVCQGINGGNNSPQGYATRYSGGNGGSTPVNGRLGPAHDATLSSLSSSSGRLCDAGSVESFRTTQTGWTWTCAGYDGGTSVNGWAYRSGTGSDAIDGRLGSAHKGSFTDLQRTSRGLCEDGDVINFRYNASSERWTWTCAGINGGTSVSGWASLSSEESTDCSVQALPRTGSAPLSTSLLCRGGPDGARTALIIKEGSRTLDSFASSSRNYTFEEAGTYTVLCYPDVSSSDQGESCRLTVEVTGECGNDIRESGEQCDDGNTLSGDGCSRICRSESVDEGDPICGNGILESHEQCDDGDTDNGDSCTNICQNQTPTTGAGKSMWMILGMIALSGTILIYRRLHS